MRRLKPDVQSRHAIQLRARRMALEMGHDLHSFTTSREAGFTCWTTCKYCGRDVNIHWDNLSIYGKAIEERCDSRKLRDLEG